MTFSRICFWPVKILCQNPQGRGSLESRVIAPGYDRNTRKVLGRFPSRLYILLFRGTSQKRKTSFMVKKTATFGGLALVLAGLIGLAAPRLLGMHPSVVHNLVHLLCGALALFLGLKI